MPVYFMHWWLPKLHVEARTVGSIILASLLLLVNRGLPPSLNFWAEVNLISGALRFGTPVSETEG
jgi:NADH:ubiquinone oxidoreductase subunit 4 (subunit M)